MRPSIRRKQAFLIGERVTRLGPLAGGAQHRQSRIVAAEGQQHIRGGRLRLGRDGEGQWSVVQDA